MRDYPEKIEKLQFELAAMNRAIQNERERIDVMEADLTKRERSPLSFMQGMNRIQQQSRFQAIVFNVTN